MEQKNWTHVRQLLGYQRLEDPALLPAINALYRDVWEPLHHYFMPTSKLISKDRHGAKVRRRHDKPLTPCERLLASNSVTASAKRLLRSIRASLDPIALHHQLETGLRRILSTTPRTHARPQRVHRDAI